MRPVFWMLSVIWFASLVVFMVPPGGRWREGFFPLPLRILRYHTIGSVESPPGTGPGQRVRGVRLLSGAAGVLLAEGSRHGGGDFLSRLPQKGPGGGIAERLAVFACLAGHTCQGVGCLVEDVP